MSKYKAKERASRMEHCRLTFLFLLSPSNLFHCLCHVLLYSKTPKQVFFNVIHILTLLPYYYTLIIIFFLIYHVNIIQSDLLQQFVVPLFWNQMRWVNLMPEDVRLLLWMWWKVQLFMSMIKVRCEQTTFGWWIPLRVRRFT